MRGVQCRLNPLSSTTPLTNFIRHGRLQRLLPPPLSLTGDPSSLPRRHQRMLEIQEDVGCDCQGESASATVTQSLLSLYHALSLSVTASLPQRCDNGGPSVPPPVPPDASGSATRRAHGEKGAYRNLWLNAAC